VIGWEPSNIDQTTNASWERVGHLLDGDNALDNFRTSLALSSDGDTIAIGSLNNVSTGYGYVFEYQFGNWTKFGQTLTSGDFHNSDIVKTNNFAKLGKTWRDNLKGSNFESNISLSNDRMIMAIGSDEIMFVYTKDVNTREWKVLGDPIVVESSTRVVIFKYWLTWEQIGEIALYVSSSYITRQKHFN
jgi:hypothetical protein